MPFNKLYASQLRFILTQFNKHHKIKGVRTMKKTNLLSTINQIYNIMSDGPVHTLTSKDGIGVNLRINEGKNNKPVIVKKTKEIAKAIKPKTKPKLKLKPKKSKPKLKLKPKKSKPKLKPKPKKSKPKLKLKPKKSKPKLKLKPKKSKPKKIEVCEEMSAGQAFNKILRKKKPLKKFKLEFL
jgi:hypothetical protein